MSPFNFNGDFAKHLAKNSSLWYGQDACYHPEQAANYSDQNSRKMQLKPAKFRIFLQSEPRRNRKCFHISSTLRRIHIKLVLLANLSPRVKQIWISGCVAVCLYIFGPWMPKPFVYSMQDIIFFISPTMFEFIRAISPIYDFA